MITVLRQMYPFIRPQLKWAIIAALCSLPISAIKAYQAFFVKNVIDGVFNPMSTQEEAFKLAAILVGLALINYPFRFIHFYGMRTVVLKASCLIRSKVYKKLQHLSAKYFSEQKQGHLLSIMINDTNIFSEGFMNGLDSIREPITAIMLLSVALYHDWQLTLIIFAVLPFFLFIFIFTGRRIRKYMERAQEDTAIMTHHAAEGLSGQKIIKAFNLQDYMLTRFDRAQDDFYKHKDKSNAAEEHSHPMVEVVGSFAFATVIVAAFYRAQSGMSTGEFISFVSALAMFMDPVRRFSKANTRLNQARAAAQRIFDLLDIPEEEDQGGLPFTELKDKIEIKNLSFSYGKKKVLHNFNLTIHKGEKVALVGLSGSGKSTLVNLLLRLYAVPRGMILIDGEDINDYKLEDIREAFALVSQDIFLFNDTVLENIKAGNIYSEEQVAKALQVSYAQEFVQHLPQHTLTTIGDRGMRLSGGQGQRLTIARAFLRDCPIMLFDEATSALDNESEQVVQKAMDELAGHKTVVAIAHRLSTIQNYDRIVVLKAGQKIEEGHHSDLMQLAGEYKKLYELTQL